MGGGYTFQSDIFYVFCKLANSRQDEFIIFCESQNKSSVIKEIKLPNNCELVQLPVENKREKFARVLITIIPQIRRYFGKQGRLSKAAKKYQIELLWYLSGGVYEIIDQPYIATVWDVQHRTHPWLPEVSNSGVWESREVYHSTFLRRATKIITGTQVGLEQLSYFYQIPPERVVILPHPTPSLELNSEKTSTDIRSTFNIKGDYFIYPAQFWPHKNHITLMAALKELGDNHNFWPNLIFIGSDKGNKSFVQLNAHKLGVSNQIIFTGFVSVSDLVALYRDATALVYLSMSGPENLPPLEAFALNCPVIASDIPGAKEQLEDCALFVPPYDVGAISDGMYKILTDDKLREILISKGNVRAKQFTAYNFVEGVFQLFDEISLVRKNWK